MKFKLCLLAGCMLTAGCDAPGATDGATSIAAAYAQGAGSEPFATIVGNDIPDLCTILDKQAAQRSLDAPADKILSEPHACDWYAADAPIGNEPSDVHLAVMSYDHERFDAHGVRGDALGERLLQVTSFPRLDVVEDIEAGSAFVADDGHTANLLIVPDLHFDPDASGRPHDVVVWAQLDNPNLTPAERQQSIEPMATRLAHLLWQRAQAQAG